eukprot:gene5628-9445_t
MDGNPTIDCGNTIEDPCKNFRSLLNGITEETDIFIISDVNVENWNCTDINLLVHKSIKILPYNLNKKVTFNFGCHKKQNNDFILKNGKKEVNIQIENVNFIGNFVNFPRFIEVSEEENSKIILTNFEMKNVYLELIHSEKWPKNSSITVENSNFHHLDKFLSISSDNQKVNDSHLIFKNTNFENSTGSLFNIYDTVSTSIIVTFDNCTFHHNHYANSFSRVILNIKNSFFLKNGGTNVLDSKFSIVNSTFEKNERLFNILFSNTKIENSQFISNIGGNGGALTVSHTDLVEIFSSTFKNNSAKQQGGAIRGSRGSKEKSTMIIKNCEFEDNFIVGSNDKEFGGGAISLLDYYRFELEDSKFIKNNASVSSFIGQGGAVFLRNEMKGWAILKRNFYQSNVAVYGGGIYIEGDLFRVDITEDIFKNHENIRAGAAIYVEDSVNLFINDCHFENSNTASLGGALLLDEALTQIFNSTFKNCKSNEGGAIKVLSGYLTIFTSTFTLNSADNKGGSVMCKDSTCQCEHCNFENNSAKKGGSFYVDKSILTLQKSKFISNVADEGGSIYSSQFSTIKIVNVEFTSNLASLGGVFYSKSELTSSGYPLILEFEKTIFKDNFAEGGGIIYFSGNILPKEIFQNGTNGNIFINSLAESYGDIYATNPRVANLTNDTPVKVYPKQILNLNFEVFDAFYQRIRSHPTFNLKLEESSKPYEIVGSYSRAISDGKLFFGDNSIRSKIGSKFTIAVSSPSEGDSIFIQQVDVEVQHCPMRFKQVDVGNLEECQMCQRKYYSFEKGKCIQCPKNLICEEEEMHTQFGFWKFEKLNHPVSVYPCENGKCESNKCIEHRDISSPICSSCLPGFEEWSETCIISTSKNPSFWLILMFFQIIMVLSLFHCIGQTSMKSGTVSIFYFYIQTLLLFIGNSTPFFSVFKFLNLHLEDSWTIKNWLKLKFKQKNFDEIRNRSESITQTTFQMYGNLVLNSKFITTLFHSFFEKNAFVSTILNLFLYTYQTILVTSLAFFQCKKFGDQHHILTSTNIICYTSTYFNWILVYAVLILYCFIFPIFIFLFLFISRRKKMLFTKKFSNYFGSLYLHYQPKYYYFESIFFFQRIILVLTNFFVLMFSNSTAINYFIIASVVIIFSVIQLILKPFSKKSDNTLHEISLFSLIFIVILRGFLIFDSRQFWISTTIFIYSLMIYIYLFLKILLSNSFFIFLKESLIGFLKSKKLKAIYYD